MFKKWRPRYDSRRVANFFLNKEPLTQMKLHKLLYYAHGWHLGLTGSPLLNEEPEAWTYGPVIPSIYQAFKVYGADLITRGAHWPDPLDGSFVPVPPVDESDGFVYDLLERTWEIYGHLTAAQLSTMTHLPDSPWTRTKRGNRGVVYYPRIPNSLMREHFERRVAENRSRKARTQTGSAKPQS